jgi:hypothetical protein
MLCVHAIGARIPPHRVLSVFAVLALLFMPYQLLALERDEKANHKQLVAALALELGVADEDQLNVLYPRDSLQTLELSREAVARNWSIFGHPLIEDVALRLEETAPVTSGAACTGGLEHLSAIEGDARFLKVEGWLYDPEHRAAPKSAWLTDRDGRIVGYALTGMAREDIAHSLGKYASRAGFSGYLLTAYGEQPLSLLADNPGCRLEVAAPAS